MELLFHVFLFQVLLRYRGWIGAERSALPLQQQIEFEVKIRAVRGKHYLPLGTISRARAPWGKGAESLTKIIYQI